MAVEIVQPYALAEQPNCPNTAEMGDLLQLIDSDTKIK